MSQHHKSSNLMLIPNRKRHDYTSLDIQYEEEYGLAWYYMHASPRPCFTSTLLDEIHHWQTHLVNQQDHDIQYTVLASNVSGVFNLGGDLDLFAQLIRSKDREGLMRYAVSCVDAVFRTHTALGSDITTIALVQGDALGGGLEAAMSNEIVIAERSSKMGLPEILFNLFPGMGAYSFLSRKIGVKQAEEMILGGRLYSAEELHDMGVVDILADDGQGEMAVYDYIEKESKKRNGIRALRAAEKYCNPVTYKELADITEVWVDAALRLQEKDLRMMGRLVNKQSVKVK